MKTSTTTWICAAFLAAWAPIQAGCASDCAKTKSEYESALAAESPFAEINDAAMPLHFGVSVRDELLNEVVDRALASGLEKALSLTDKVSLATGQSIGLSTRGKVADLGLSADPACDACLRVDGRLGGSLGVKLPLLGDQRVPLQGSFSIVAPVRFAAQDGGKAAVVLDLKEASDLARSQVTPEVTQLPPTWWKIIKSPLSKMLADALVKDLPPVTLLTFEGFDFGVEGLKVLPAKVVTDAKKGVVFAGFTTNIDAPEAALVPRTDLGKNDDVAIGISPSVIAGLAVALLNSGKISRTWTKDGDEDPNGPIHVTTPTVALTAADSGPQPYQMNFRAWNIPGESKCWWADAEAKGNVSTTADGKLAVDVSSVKLTDSSLPGVFQTIANWSSSKLVSASSEALTKTLSPQSVDLAGSTVKLEKSRLKIDATGAWLSGSVGLTATKK